jgi:hypothetical protein
MVLLEVQIDQDILGIINYIFMGVSAGILAFITVKFSKIAEKSEVAEITRRIEDVKKDFNENLSKLNSRLDYQNTIRVSLRGSRIEAIREVYKNYFLWSKEVLSFKLTLMRNDDKLYEYINRCNILKDVFQQSTALYRLYNPELEQRNITNEAYNVTEAYLDLCIGAGYEYSDYMRKIYYYMNEETSDSNIAASREHRENVSKVLWKFDKASLELRGKLLSENRILEKAFIESLESLIKEDEVVI